MKQAALAAVAAAAISCAPRQPPVTPAARPAAAAPSPPVRQLGADLAAVFGAPIAARGSWAVDVRSLDRGDALFQLDARKLVMPASNMKILTVATAAEVLGWEHRFTTTLETSAPVEHGVLMGDLFIRGSGDPSINERGGRAAALLAEWTSALKAAGIVEIDGRIIGDDQAFDDEWLGAGWAWDYLQYGYAAPVGALQFNENLTRLTVTAGAAAGDPAIVTLPAGAGLTIESRVVTSPEGSDDTIDYRRRLDRPSLEVTGTIAIGTSVARTVAVVNPTVFFAQAVKEAFVERGIAVTGPAVDMDDVAGEIAALPERRVLVSSESPPLREIASVLMKVSQNLYAETLVKAIGAAQGGVGTIPGGRVRMREVLASWGIPSDSWIMADGSGLSRYNYVTAEGLVSILERMHRDEKHRGAFEASLPIAGRDGTLASRMRRTRAENNALAKTGSIAHVRSLSGYVRTRDGELLAFAIIANDFVMPAGMATWISDLAVETLSNFKR